MQCQIKMVVTPIKMMAMPTKMSVMPIMIAAPLIKIAITVELLILYRVMKKLVLIMMATVAFVCTNAQSVVYFTKDISPEALVNIYDALGKPATGRVAVKISTGESELTYYLRPNFIKPLVDKVGGTIVECNTAYGGNRSNTASHRRAIEQRGFTQANGFKTVDIMDEDGDMQIPVKDSTWIRHDIVGSHLANYDFMINLAHFKGHAMGGFGGVLKNQSIGVASHSGKSYIHSAGSSVSSPWGNRNQDSFLESMAAAAQAVHDYFHGNVLYINVMNNLSVDCDCDGSPSAPQMKDVGILASTDPVALDKACLDIVFSHQNTSGDNATPLQNRITSRHGTHIVEYAEKIGLGSLKYTLVNLDDATGIHNAEANAAQLYNVYDLNGVKILDRAKDLSSLAHGTYIINGIKTEIH